MRSRGSWSTRPPDRGPDLGRLLLDADADELKDTRNAQLSTFVLQPGGARRGRAPRRRRRVAPATASASTPRCRLRRPVLRRRLPLVAERGEAMQARGRGPRRARWPPCSASTTTTSRSRVARVDGDVWVANYNAPGQVVIAGAPEAVAAATATAKELGAKKVMPLPVARRLPHAVHGAGRATGSARPSPPRARATPTSRSSPTSTRWPTPTAPTGRASSPPSCAAPCGGASRLLALADLGVTTFVELGPGQRADRHGQAHHHRTRPRSRWPPRTNSTRCSSASRAARRRRSQCARGRAPVRDRAHGREPRRRCVHARSDDRPRHGARSRRAHCSAVSATTRCAPPSADRSWASRGRRRARRRLSQPIAWLRTA